MTRVFGSASLRLALLLGIPILVAAALVALLASAIDPAPPGRS